MVMRFLSWCIRLRTNFANRPVTLPSAEEVLGQLRDDMNSANIGPLPPFFEMLRPRPDLLAVQAAATRAALLENQLSRRINLSVAYVISALNGDAVWKGTCATGLQEEGVALAALDDLVAAPYSASPDCQSRLDAAILRFAIDITLAADRTTASHVTTLRALGFTDSMILDLVAVSAAVNAGNRLNRMLVPPGSTAWHLRATPLAMALP